MWRFKHSSAFLGDEVNSKSLSDASAKWTAPHTNALELHRGRVLDPITYTTRSEAFQLCLHECDLSHGKGPAC